MPIRPYRPPSSPHPLHISTLSPGFGITVIHRFQDTKLFYFPRWVGLPPMGISPLVAYRPEHGFLTTSTLYGRMCHILHTCTLNSSSHSMYDTRWPWTQCSCTNESATRLFGLFWCEIFSHLILQSEPETISTRELWWLVLLMRFRYMRANLLLYREQQFEIWRYCRTLCTYFECVEEEGEK